MGHKILKHQHQLETCQKELKFQGFLFSGCIFETLILSTTYIEILLISYSTPGIQQWHVSLKPHRVEYPIIHPRWNSRFGYTLNWVQTRPGCDVVLLVTATIEMYKCIYYLQLSAQCGGWRIQYRSPRTTMQLSDTALAVTTWPDNVHTAVWMGN